LEGANVAFCALRPASVEAALSALGRTGKVAGRAADVRKADEADATIAAAEERFGGVDILINNAGLGVFAPVAGLSVEDWRRTIDTNLSGVFYFCRAAIAAFRRRGGGHIVNISSLAGRNSFRGGAAYNASKAGLNLFTEALLLDHRAENIRATTISPGSVDTEFSPRETGGSADWKIAPEDVAEVVVSVLRMPSRTLISTVEIRPSKPPK
jgi:NADP-dependent 3-hydroxy acid dehydrogenase YdfG